MAIRNIREEGDEILKKVSRQVEQVDDKIRELLEDMAETMHKYNGVGLAAVQVGVLKRIIVIDLYDDQGVKKLVNPVIIKQKGEQEVEEGCLSFPNKYAKIVRPAEVTIESLYAQALCHEIDHLNGIVFVDKIISGTLEYVEPKKGRD